MNSITTMPTYAPELQADVQALPLVQAHNLRRAFPQAHNAAEEVVAVAKASCTIRPNARIAIMGRSGSGKSTLIHLLAGLDTPTGGSIEWPALGPRDSLRPAKIALVFQSQSLLPPLSVLENVELPLLLTQVAKARAEERARTVLAEMQLTHLVDKLPEELSGGQAQQVAIARVLALRPPLILADEPTGQLDQATAQRLLDLWLGALEGSDTALVIATHDQNVAAQLQTQWTMTYGKLEGGTQ